MTTHLKSAALAAALGLSLLQPAEANLVYNVNESFGGGTITGTLTTDGTLGAITNQSHFVDWNITLSHGSNSSSLTSANSTLFSLNFKFDATLNTLTFDHSFGNYFLVYEKNLVGFWCLEGPLDGCSGKAGTSNFSVNVNGQRDYIFSAVGHNSTFTNGNALPEPASVILVGMGCLAAALTRKRS